MALQDTSIGKYQWPAKQRWVFHFAACTTVLTLVLLLSGGQVTSYDVGMAVPDWPTSFGQNMFLFPWLGESAGVMIEHRHRLVGALVGMLTIGLVGLLWISESRRWLCWMGVLALAAVILQGLLGGLRVLQNGIYGRELAALHGVLAQICFGFMVALCVWTSSRWRADRPVSHPLATQLRWLLGSALGLLWLQILFGAFQRHLGQGFVVHLVLAGVWTILAFWIVLVIGLDLQLRQRFLRSAIVLTTLTVMQIFLGLGAMLATKLAAPGMGGTPTSIRALVATLHLATGSLLLATTVVLLLGSFRYVGGDSCRRLAEKSATGVASNIASPSRESLWEVAR